MREEQEPTPIHGRPIAPAIGLMARRRWLLVVGIVVGVFTLVTIVLTNMRDERVRAARMSRQSNEPDKRIATEAPVIPNSETISALDRDKVEGAMQRYYFDQKADRRGGDRRDDDDEGIDPMLLEVTGVTSCGERFILATMASGEMTRVAGRAALGGRSRGIFVLLPRHERGSQFNGGGILDGRMEKVTDDMFWQVKQLPHEPLHP